MFAGEVRRLGRAEMDAAAAVRRASFDAALPRLAGLHTAEEDRAFWRERVFTAGPVWGAFLGGRLVGVAALREEWVDQLYVLPAAQGEGAGSALLAWAKEGAGALELWTFAANARARRFYEARGFCAVEETDGSGNEEREPDVRYRWERGWEGVQGGGPTRG